MYFTSGIDHSPRTQFNSLFILQYHLQVTLSHLVIAVQPQTTVLLPAGIHRVE